MRSETDPSFTPEECGLANLSEEGKIIHNALVVDPFMRYMNAPYWKGLTREFVQDYIVKEKVNCAAWICSQQWPCSTED